MCRAIEEMRNETAREAEHANAVQIAKCMLESGDFSYEQVAEYVDLPVEEVKALDEKVIA